MNILWWLVLPGALLIGLLLFALFGMFVTGVRWEWKRDERLAKLESKHHMVSQSEVERQVNLIRQMHGKPEEVKQMMLERLEVMETLDKQAWHARVQEIVELQCPCPDEWFDELDAELRERGW